MNFLDLFSGIGGFRVALEKQGHNCVFSSEVDKFAIETYKEYFSDQPAGDITKIDAERIPPFDILTAGFPCQPFSYAGLNEGFKDKTRGTLFFDIKRIIQHHKPKMFLLENVKGLKSHKRGATLETITNVLKNELNYHIHWTILNSYDFGVPQYRERWYCVGFDRDIDFEFPTGKAKKTFLRDIVDIDNNDPNLRLNQFDIDRIIYHFSSDQIRVEHDSSRYEKHTKKGRHGVFSYLKPDGTLRFHIGDVAKTQIQEAYYGSIHSVAPAIIANRMPKLWDLKRRLSVEECRKLQGFPGDFKFPVSNAQAYKQLGNSVTVPVIEEITKCMIHAYKKARNNKIQQSEQLAKSDFCSLAN